MNYKNGVNVMERAQENNTQGDISQTRPEEVPGWAWDGFRMREDLKEALTGKLAETQMRYLTAVFTLGGAGTDYEVSLQSGMPVHLISARRNELKNRGLILSANWEKKQGPYGSLNTIWHIDFNRLKQYAEL